ncbi:hypothetical protein [Pleomorphovibrio marinus]|uniref:hypothetical protein n=1 Tax=Pleomorphovibrio marinus TaxID=2164132 RepID=UPI000E0B00A6|nr:hypothetical protein [Pleomorphovibrio marinus]
MNTELKFLIIIIIYITLFKFIKKLNLKIEVVKIIFTNIKIRYNLIKNNFISFEYLSRLINTLMNESNHDEYKEINIQYLNSTINDFMISRINNQVKTIDGIETLLTMFKKHLQLNYEISTTMNYIMFSSLYNSSILNEKY